MAEMTLVLDVVSNVDYSKITAEVQKIRDNLAKIPDKVKIDIQVDTSGSASTAINNLRKQINALSGSTEGVGKAVSKDIEAARTKANAVYASAWKSIGDRMGSFDGAPKEAVDKFNELAAAMADLESKLGSDTTTAEQFASSIGKVTLAAKEMNAAFAERDAYDKMVSQDAKALKDLEAARTKANAVYASGTKALGNRGGSQDGWSADQKSSYSALGTGLESLKSKIDSGTASTEELNAAVNLVTKSANEMNAAFANTDVATKKAAQDAKALKDLEAARTKANAVYASAKQTLAARSRDVRPASKEKYDAYNAEVNNLGNMLKDKTASAEELASAVGKVTFSAKEMNTAFAENGAEWKDAQARIKEYTNSAKTLSNAEKNLKNWSKMSLSGNGEVRDAYSSFKSAVVGLREAQTAYDGTAESAERLALANQNVADTMQKAEAVGKKTGTIASTLSAKISGIVGQIAPMVAGIRGVQLAIRSTKYLINEATKIDDSMTQLRIVTNESDNTFKQYGEDVAKTAQKIGSSITDVIDATTVFARLGYSLSESSTLAELTAMLQRVGDVEASDAQASLTSIIKAYNVDVSDMEGVMDKLITVGNNFPISASEIATGMMNASSSLAAAGNSFDKSVALIAAANTTLQDANKASTGLRTITARLRKTDTELDDLGEAMTESAYDDLVGALTKYNVSLRDSNGEYRDTYDIMQSIAKVWDTMSSSEQAALAELAAGNRQQTVFYSIIQNFENVAEKAMEAMNNSPGAMQDAYGKWMDSITAHVETLKAAFQGLSNDLVSNDLLKDFVDLGTVVVNIADGFVKWNDNLLKFTTTAGLVITAVTSFKSIYSAIKNKGGLHGGGIETFLYIAGDKNTNSNIIKFFADIGRGAKEAASNVDSSAGLIKKGLAGIGGGIKGAWDSIGVLGKIGIAAAAVGIVVGAIQQYQAKMEEARQKADAAATAFSESTTSIDEYASKITELRATLDNSTTTEAEAYQAKKELYEIQTQLNSTYGDAASGIDLVNGSLDEQIAKLRELKALEASDFLNKNQGDFEKAAKKMTGDFGGNGGTFLGSFVDNGTNEDIGKINEIIAKYKDLKTEIDESDGTVRISVVGDNVTEAKKTIGDFMSDLRALDGTLEDSSVVAHNMIQGILDRSSKAYSKADKVISDYKNIYEQGLKAKMIEEEVNSKTYGLDGGEQRTASTWLNEYTSAIEKYNSALASGDTSQIAAAQAEFGELDSTIQALLSDSNGMGVFSTLFTDVAGALDQAALSAYNFNESIKRTQEADFLQRSGFKQSEFVNAFLSGTEGNQTYEAVRTMLEKYAEQFGLDLGSLTIDQIEAAAAYFAQLGIIIKDVAAAASADTESALKKSSDSTLKAISDIQNVQKVLSGQETGKSISLDDFNSEDLKDYASAIEYINGTYQLNTERVNELVKAKTQEQIATVKANKAQEQAQYLENARKIAQYRNQLDAAKASGDKSTDTIERSIQALLSENSSILANCSSYELMISSLEEATSAYQNWINAQSASNTGDMFDSAVKAIQQIDDTLNNSDSELFGRVGREDYKAAVDFIVPDSVDKEDTDAVNNYLDSIEDMFTYDKSGNWKGLNIQNFLDESLAQGLLVEDEDGYRIAGEKSMQDFADGLGLSLPLVQAMFGELQEFGSTFDWSDEATKSFGDLAVSATEAAETLRGKLGDKYQLSIDVSDADKNLSTVDDQVSYLDKTITDMQDAIGKRETIGLDDSEVVAAQNIIRAAVAEKQLLKEPDIMKVDTSVVQGKLGEAVATLQKFREAKNSLETAKALDIGVDAAQAKLDSATKAVQALDSSITDKKVLNIDTTSADTISSSIQNLSADMIVEAGIDDKAVLGYSPDNKDATVTYGIDRTAVDEFDPPNLTRTVTYTASMASADGVSAAASKASSSSGGTSSTPKQTAVAVNGSANVSGSAKLNGDWRAKAGRSLVGELGREIIVDADTGRWYTVGDNGAEFTDIPDNAIVFNHKQSDALLRYGHAVGRGTANVSGSAYVRGNIPQMIDLVGTIGSNKRKKKTGSSKSGSSGSGSGSSQSSGGGSSGSSSKPERIDWPEIALNRIEALITKLTNVVSSSFKNVSSKLGASNDAIKQTLKQIDMEQSAYNTYMKEANSVGLAESLAVQVREGNVYHLGTYDSDDTEKIQEYQKWYEKALDCKTAIDDLHESLAELYKGRFDNIQEDYNNQLSLMEKQTDSLNKKIEMLEERGYMQNANYYRQMQDIERQNVQTLTNELAELNRYFDEAMASGEIEEGSDAWYEMKSSIEDTKAAIDDAELSIVKYGNSIRQIEWDYFDYAQERVSKITDEAKFLEDLIDGKDMFDEKGNITSTGSATMGLYAQSYGVYMAQADKYAEEIKKINQQLASDPNNKDLLARRDELLESQRDSILAAKDEKEAMIDLAQNGVQAQLDALRELIDAYTDSLDSAKDLYDYQKKIAEKTSNISSLEKQLAAYQSDMSEETKAKVQKIQLDLKEAQADLKDTEYDRFVSDTKDALDAMYDEYEEYMNDRFDDVDELFGQLIGVVNANAADISKYLNGEAGSVGYDITAATKSIWESGGSANAVVAAYGTEISGKLTTVATAVGNIFTVLSAIAKKNGVSFGEAKSYKSGGLIDYTGIANVHGSASDPEAVLDSADTKNFIMLRDAMRNADITNMLRSTRDDDLNKIIGADTHTLGKVGSSGGYSIGDISVVIPIDHVSDYNDFVNQLKRDKQFERLIQDVTIGRVAGKSGLEKNKYRW